MKSAVAWIASCLLISLLLGCTEQRKDDGLKARIYQYAAVIRWNEIDQAAAFIAPELRAEQSLTPTQRERWRQLQVARYNEGPQAVDADGSVRQMVEIDLINRNTQVMRSIVDHQIWRFDPTTKTWWLHSGLPDLDAGIP